MLALSEELKMYLFLRYNFAFKAFLFILIFQRMKMVFAKKKPMENLERRDVSRAMKTKIKDRKLLSRFVWTCLWDIINLKNINIETN
jgi:hypothetical protein